MFFLFGECLFGKQTILLCLIEQVLSLGSSGIWSDGVVGSPRPQRGHTLTNRRSATCGRISSAITSPKESHIISVSSCATPSETVNCDVIANSAGRGPAVIIVQTSLRSINIITPNSGRTFLCCWNPAVCNNYSLARSKLCFNAAITIL